MCAKMQIRHFSVQVTPLTRFYHGHWIPMAFILDKLMVQFRKDFNIFARCEAMM
jgi:hypothetical protein